MYIVCGATGHVGQAVLRTLLAHRCPAIGLVHSKQRAPAIEALGAEVQVIDLRDAKALGEVFRRGQRAFLLNPPGNVRGDAESEELETAHSLVQAVETSNLEKVVVQSTQGAQSGEGIGDLGVLKILEDGVLASGVPASITRAGFFMSNWDQQLGFAREGFITTPFAADFPLPMVAPVDLGRFNAKQLMEAPLPEGEVIDLFGPREYSSQEVASAFAKSLEHPVDLRVVPRESWENYFQGQGYSAASARSFSRMTGIVADGDYAVPKQIERGRTGLEVYINQLSYPANRSA